MTIADTRRARLREYIETVCDGNAAEVSRRSGKSPSQINDTLSGRKSFGEKVARNLEKELGLPELWFDQSDAQENTVAAVLSQIAPILEHAPDSIRQAVLDLVLKYEHNPEEGERVAAAIRALAGAHKQ